MTNEIDFPVFTITGDDFFDKEVETAIKLRMEIDESIDKIDEMNDKLTDIGVKLNLYLNNIVKLNKPFDYLEDIIIFKNETTASVYKNEIFENLLDELDVDEDDDILYENLPAPISQFTLNKKQANRCMKLIDDYNDLYAYYEDEVYDYNVYLSWYDYIIDEVKEHLSEIKLLEVNKGMTKDDLILEPFNDEIHELLMTQNVNDDSWHFVYLRKEDKEKFLDLIEDDIDKVVE